MDDLEKQDENMDDIFRSSKSQIFLNQRMVWWMLHIGVQGGSPLLSENKTQKTNKKRKKHWKSGKVNMMKIAFISEFRQS